MAFDLVELDGEDLRESPLIERKRQLRRLIPAKASRLRYVDHIAGRGRALFAAACRRDLEGVVAKWAHGTYQRDLATSWLKTRTRSTRRWKGDASCLNGAVKPRRRGLARSRQCCGSRTVTSCRS